MLRGTVRTPQSRRGSRVACLGSGLSQPESHSTGWTRATWLRLWRFAPAQVRLHTDGYLSLKATRRARVFFQFRARFFCAALRSEEERPDGNGKKLTPLEPALDKETYGRGPARDIFLTNVCRVTRSIMTSMSTTKMLGRHFIGIEIDEGYCQTARNRLRDTEAPLFGEAT